MLPPTIGMPGRIGDDSESRGGSPERAGTSPVARGREVGGRTHHHHTQIRSDADGHHVLFHLVAQAHADVVTLGDDVGHAVVHIDLHLAWLKLKRRTPTDRTCRSSARPS